MTTGNTPTSRGMSTGEISEMMVTARIMVMKALQVNARLTEEYPDAHCALDFTTPFQLAVATILSAQCTDERVNKTTPALFALYPTEEEMAAADLTDIEAIVKPCGFYHNKAKNIQAMAREIVGHGLPDTMDELVSLPGIGRKTANVILGNAFDTPGLPVDTHVKRVSNRLGLTTHQDPVKIEKDLCEQLPEEEWTMFSHRLIYHGRQVCQARKPNCERCVLEDLCASR